MKAYPLKPPCGHHFHGRHGHGSPVKNRWRFSKFREKYETLTLTLKICILQENGFKELKLVLLESLFLGLRILFYYIVGQTIYWSTAIPWTSPKTRSNDLERSKFRQQVQSFVCVPPWRRLTFEFLEMLINASEVTLVPKIFFSLKFSTLCKVLWSAKWALLTVLYWPNSPLNSEHDDQSKVQM